MTERKERIIFTALNLFAEHGYNSTSTSKVAKAAQVSEGLIFRHFQNKEGLLEAIMEIVREQAYKFYAPIIAKSDPKELIKGVLEIPFNLNPEHASIWKLMHSLRWQADEYDHSFSAPIKAALVESFKKLNHKDPMAEAEAIIILMDGIAAAILLRKPKKLENIKQVIFEKYL